MTQSSPLNKIAKPESVVEAIRKFVRGEGREKDTGRSQLRGAISFYSKEKNRKDVVEFLQRVLKHG